MTEKSRFAVPSIRNFKVFQSRTTRRELSLILAVLGPLLAAGCRLGALISCRVSMSRSGDLERFQGEFRDQSLTTRRWSGGGGATKWENCGFETLCTP